MSDATTAFDAFQPYYDIMVDWERRLPREGPFFQRTLATVAAQRVLDCACGTGHHVRQFARWGLDAVGSDLAPAMIEAARRLAREEGAAVRFEVADFRRLPETFSQPFDAVMCTGNSLPLAGSPDGIREAIAGMRDVLRPDGLLILGCLNFEQIPEGRTLVEEPRVRCVDNREILFLKIFRKIRRRCDLTIVVLEKTGGAWSKVESHATLWAVRQQELEGMLTEAGFGRIHAYGGYELKPFDPATSPGLILVARKAKE
ncbi:MAG: class I SAM-dependent methyltransferase [Planctomycetes bacterium]|nr:class I SAM-dependent methyltransferase [Planctomycetota bacterium]